MGCQGSFDGLAWLGLDISERSQKKKQGGGYQGCDGDGKKPVGIYPINQVIENPFEHCICNEIK